MPRLNSPARHRRGGFERGEVCGVLLNEYLIHNLMIDLIPARHLGGGFERGEVRGVQVRRRAHREPRLVGSWKGHGRFMEGSWEASPSRATPGTTGISDQYYVVIK